ncbi:MAG: hypothetical protein WKF81_04240 [Thermomicrobiales bacterium]
MAVLVHSTYTGVRQEDYDTMIGQVEPQFLSAQGFIAHIAVKQGEGFEVTEIWELDEALQTWIRDVITPMMQNAGGSAPQVRSEPIHHYFINGLD